MKGKRHKKNKTQKDDAKDSEIEKDNNCNNISDPSVQVYDSKNVPYVSQLDSFSETDEIANKKLVNHSSLDNNGSIFSENGMYLKQEKYTKFNIKIEKEEKNIFGLEDIPNKNLQSESNLHDSEISSVETEPLEQPFDNFSNDSTDSFSLSDLYENNKVSPNYYNSENIDVVNSLSFNKCDNDDDDLSGSERTLVIDWDPDERLSLADENSNRSIIESSSRSSVISTVEADYVCFEEDIPKINEEALFQRLVFKNLSTDEESLHSEIKSDSESINKEIVEKVLEKSNNDDSENSKKSIIAENFFIENSDSNTEITPICSEIKFDKDETEDDEIHDTNNKESLSNFHSLTLKGLIPIKQEKFSDDELIDFDKSSSVEEFSESKANVKISEDKYSVIKSSSKETSLKVRLKKLKENNNVNLIEKDDNRNNKTKYEKIEKSPSFYQKKSESKLCKVKEKIKKSSTKKTILLETLDEIPTILKSKRKSNKISQRKKKNNLLKSRWENVLRSRTKDLTVEKELGKNLTEVNKETVTESQKLSEKFFTKCRKGIPAPVPFPRPSVPITLNHILAEIGSWNVNWLDEQKSNIDPPPDIFDTCKARKPNLSYVCYDEYYDTYAPFLMLEIWQHVTNCWQRRNINNTGIVSVSVSSYEIKGEIIILHCKTLLNDQSKLRKNFPYVGHLVILYLNLHGCIGQAQVFGYVVDYKVEDIVVDHQYNSICMITQREKSSIISLIIKTKAREGRLNFEKPIKIETVCLLKPLIIQSEALLNIHKSVLINSILCPQERNCTKSSKSSSHSKSLLALGSYNRQQEKIILELTEAVYDPYPHIFLISGPAGTGKTHTIIGLIQQLLCEDGGAHKMKLLVITQTNCAIDEICYRLVKLQQFFKNSYQRELRFVRVGKAENTRPDLQAHCIENLINFNIERNKEDLQNNEIKLLAVENDIATMKSKLQTCNYENEICYDGTQEKVEQLLLDRKFYHKRVSYLRSKFHIDMEKTRGKMRSEILENADVILTTILDCRCSALLSIYGNIGYCRFNCCIIDDSTQLTEVETIVPLLYDTDKLILVGDPEQLTANVSSAVARRFGYQQSFFERYQAYFEKLCDTFPNNFYILNEQYRMHSDIYYFSSSYFYKNKVITPPQVDKNRRFLHMHSCIIFDIMDGQNSTESPFNIFNPQEAHFIIQLCSEISRFIKCDWNAGIITPYVGQCDILRKNLPKELKDKHHVEIGTIDYFQGREKDIIILSCVQTKHLSNCTFLSDFHLFNVAITRARNLLVICGNIKYLQEWPLWKMFIKEAASKDMVVHTKSFSSNLIVHLSDNR
ncbi:uncharacterized protein [Centruroides vittatus]|uniref:uncharacterized protein n=1 Tax=Centruroides vittatus TaxID=120091 RepID=UPI00350EB295